MEGVGHRDALDVRDHPVGVGAGDVAADGKAVVDHAFGLLDGGAVVPVEASLVLVAQEGVECVACFSDPLPPELDNFLVQFLVIPTILCKSGPAGWLTKPLTQAPRQI